MNDNELFEKLEKHVELFDPDDARFESNMKERDELWNEVTKDVRDNVSHFLIMYTNILIDKGLIDESSREVFTDRILTNLYCCVMEDLKKIFDAKEK